MLFVLGIFFSKFNMLLFVFLVKSCFCLASVTWPKLAYFVKHVEISEWSILLERPRPGTVHPFSGCLYDPGCKQVYIGQDWYT